MASEQQQILARLEQIVDTFNTRVDTLLAAPFTAAQVGPVYQAVLQLFQETQRQFPAVFNFFQDTNLTIPQKNPIFTDLNAQTVEAFTNAFKVFQLLYTMNKNANVYADTNADWPKRKAAIQTTIARLQSQLAALKTPAATAASGTSALDDLDALAAENPPRKPPAAAAAAGDDFDGAADLDALLGDLGVPRAGASSSSASSSSAPPQSTTSVSAPPPAAVSPQPSAPPSPPPGLKPAAPGMPELLDSPAASPRHLASSTEIKHPILHKALAYILHMFENIQTDIHDNNRQNIPARLFLIAKAFLYITQQTFSECKFASSNQLLLESGVTIAASYNDIAPTLREVYNFFIRMVQNANLITENELIDFIGITNASITPPRNFRPNTYHTTAFPPAYASLNYENVTALIRGGVAPQPVAVSGLGVGVSGAGVEVSSPAAKPAPPRPSSSPSAKPASSPGSPAPTSSMGAPPPRPAKPAPKSAAMMDPFSALPEHQTQDEALRNHLEYILQTLAIDGVGNHEVCLLRIGKAFLMIQQISNGAFAFADRDELLPPGYIRSNVAHPLSQALVQAHGCYTSLLRREPIDIKATIARIRIAFPVQALPDAFQASQINTFKDKLTLSKLSALVKADNVRTVLAFITYTFGQIQQDLQNNKRAAIKDKLLKIAQAFFYLQAASGYRFVFHDEFRLRSSHNVIEFDAELPIVLRPVIPDVYELFVAIAKNVDTIQVSNIAGMVTHLQEMVTPLSSAAAKSLASSNHFAPFTMHEYGNVMSQILGSRAPVPPGATEPIMRAGVGHAAPAIPQVRILAPRRRQSHPNEVRAIGLGSCALHAVTLGALEAIHAGDFEANTADSFPLANYKIQKRQAWVDFFNRYQIERKNNWTWVEIKNYFDEKDTFEKQQTLQLTLAPPLRAYIIDLIETNLAYYQQRTFEAFAAEYFDLVEEREPDYQGDIFIHCPAVINAFFEVRALNLVNAEAINAELARRWVEDEALVRAFLQFLREDGTHPRAEDNGNIPASWLGDLELAELEALGFNIYVTPDDVEQPYGINEDFGLMPAEGDHAPQFGNMLRTLMARDILDKTTYFDAAGNEFFRLRPITRNELLERLESAAQYPGITPEILADQNVLAANLATLPPTTLQKLEQRGVVTKRDRVWQLATEMDEDAYTERMGAVPAPPRAAACHPFVAIYDAYYHAKPTINLVHVNRDHYNVISRTGFLAKESLAARSAAVLLPSIYPVQVSDVEGNVKSLFLVENNDATGFNLEVGQVIQRIQSSIEAAATAEALQPTIAIYGTLIENFLRGFPQQQVRSPVLQTLHTTLLRAYQNFAGIRERADVADGVKLAAVKEILNIYLNGIAIGEIPIPPPLLDYLFTANGNGLYVWQRNDDNTAKLVLHRSPRTGMADNHILLIPQAGGKLVYHLLEAKPAESLRHSPCYLSAGTGADDISLRRGFAHLYTWAGVHAIIDSLDYLFHLLTRKNAKKKYLLSIHDYRARTEHLLEDAALSLAFLQFFPQAVHDLLNRGAVHADGVAKDFADYRQAISLLIDAYNVIKDVDHLGSATRSKNKKLEDHSAGFANLMSARAIAWRVKELVNFRWRYVDPFSSGYGHPESHKPMTAARRELDIQLFQNGDYDFYKGLKLNKNRTVDSGLQDQHDYIQRYLVRNIISGMFHIMEGTYKFHEQVGRDWAWEWVRKVIVYAPAIILFLLTAAYVGNAMVTGSGYAIPLGYLIGVAISLPIAYGVLKGLDYVTRNIWQHKHKLVKHIEDKPSPPIVSQRPVPQLTQRAPGVSPQPDALRPPHSRQPEPLPPQLLSSSDDGEPPALTEVPQPRRGRAYETDLFPPPVDSEPGEADLWRRDAAELPGRLQAVGQKAQKLERALVAATASTVVIPGSRHTGVLRDGPENDPVLASARVLAEATKTEIAGKAALGGAVANPQALSADRFDVLDTLLESALAQAGTESAPPPDPAALLAAVERLRKATSALSKAMDYEIPEVNRNQELTFNNDVDGRDFSLDDINERIRKLNAKIRNFTPEELNRYMWYIRDLQAFLRNETWMNSVGARFGRTPKLNIDELSDKLHAFEQQIKTPAKTWGEVLIPSYFRSPGIGVRSAAAASRTGPAHLAAPAVTPVAPSVQADGATERDSLLGDAQRRMEEGDGGYGSTQHAKR